ncbi:SPOSA6832_00706, partial [Sporobolomyces salmonicolor]
MASTSPPAAHEHLPNTRLSRTRANLAYLANPKAAAAPGSLVTRSSLRTFRYVLKFVFWRFVRYAKYALIAAGATALAGTAIGAALPWVGALVVPSVPVAALMGLTTAAVKFTWRHRGNHFRQAWLVGGEGRDAKLDEARDAKDAEDRFANLHPRANHAWESESF